MARRICFVTNARTGDELKGGRSDSARVHGMLIDGSLGCCDPAGPTPLYDCHSRREFQDRLFDILTDWRREDQLVLYYSGHGRVVNGCYNLVFTTEAGKTEMLPFDAVVADLRTHSVKRAIVILDACESGAALAAGEKSPSHLDLPEDSIPDGIAVLASCRAKQKSYEEKDGSASVFTNLLLDGLQSGLRGQATPDGLIGIDDITSFVNDRLSEKPYDVFPQSPAYGVHGADRGIWLSRNRSVEKEPPPVETVDVARSIDELRFLYEQTGSSGHPCAKATVDDLDWDVIDAYVKNAGHSALSGNRQADARELNFFSPIDETRLHRAAVLCFAKRPDGFYPQARSIFTAGKRTRNVRPVYIQGPLPVQFRRLLDAVEQYLRRSGVGDDEVSRLYLLAVREALSNAIAHRDYTEEGSIQVLADYPNIVISSPGPFPGNQEWDTLMDGEHVSSPADAAIAWYLTSVLAFEGVGRGFEIFSEYDTRTGGGFIDCTSTDSPKAMRVRLRFDERAAERNRVDQTIMPAPRRQPKPAQPPSTEPTLSGQHGVGATQHLINRWEREGILDKDYDSVGDTAGRDTAGRDDDAGEFPNLGRYRILRVLGRGGAGAVYLAVDEQLEREVAIKVLPLRYQGELGRERFLREAKVLAKLQHANIVQIYDADVWNDQMYIVMEYLSGGTLSSWYREQGITVDVAVETVVKCAKALHYAHTKGVVHRDVKPSNILMDAESEPNLSDFGISKLGLDLSEASLTVTGQIMGTPRYMSPEQFDGEDAVDLRTDLYSLGLVLFELLSGGELPFDGDTLGALVTAKQRPPKSLRSFVPEAPQWLESICMRSIDPDPSRRFQSGEEFAAALTIQDAGRWTPSWDVPSVEPQSGGWLSKLWRTITRR